MAVPIWAAHYIGIPFKDHGRDRKGLDCWGLVRLVYDEAFGIALPSYAGEYEHTKNVRQISALIDRVSQSWKPIEPGKEKLGDVIVLRVRGAPMHVGTVLGDRQMLHIDQGIDSVIEKYTCSRWAERIEGFFRHEDTNAK